VPKIPQVFLKVFEIQHLQLLKKSLQFLKYLVEVHSVLQRSRRRCVGEHRTDGEDAKAEYNSWYRWVFSQNATHTPSPRPGNVLRTRRWVNHSGISERDGHTCSLKFSLVPEVFESASVDFPSPWQCRLGPAVTNWRQGSNFDPAETNCEETKFFMTEKFQENQRLEAAGIGEDARPSEEREVV